MVEIFVGDFEVFGDGFEDSAVGVTEDGENEAVVHESLSGRKKAPKGLVVVAARGSEVDAKEMRGGPGHFPESRWGPCEGDFPLCQPVAEFVDFLLGDGFPGFGHAGFFVGIDCGYGLVRNGHGFLSG